MAFNPPRKTSPLQDVTDRTVAAMSVSTDSCSSTEEVDNYDEFETIVREEAKAWLAMHGAKLFGLETSKYLAVEAKKKNLRGNR